MMRNLNVVILAVMVAVASAAIENTSYNGKPGCKTPEEVGQVYANFHDSTHYWLCTALFVNAREIRCPNGYGFQSSRKTCVSFTIWRWESPIMPPSCPDFEQECIPGLEIIF